MTAQMFSPLEFRNLTVKNRIFRSSISGRFDGEDGAPTQTRVNWETKFAAGGVGAIITSYVPVLMEGRIIAGYGTIHRDDFIPHWAKIGESVHAHGTKFIVQLSHSGRQLDLPGIHNLNRVALSALVEDGVHVAFCATSLDDHQSVAPLGVEVGSQLDHARLLQWATRVVALP